jgi:DNA-binding SARP family transcriptional activator/Tfp pilus assembly protein PilF
MEFGVLGPVEVWLDGQAVAAGHARQRAVLAVLLLDMGRPVPLDVLIDRVWGEDPPRTVRNVAYGYVARLKALLARAQDPCLGLSRRPGGYLLQAGPDQMDLGRFRRLVAGCAGDDERAAAELAAAVALWRGPALAGLDSPWLNAMRATLELERAAAVLDLNEVRLRRGEHAALAGKLAAQAAAAPADERLAGQLMLALYRSGRQAEALRWYEQTRRHLADELGTDPGPQLSGLHQQILRADPCLAAPPAGLQAAAPGVRDASSVFQAAPAPPRELPADVSAFTGRSAELRRLDQLLTSRPAENDTATGLDAPAGRAPTAVISAVSGTAGVGKTALAVHWAHMAAEHFADGQLYVNLRGYGPERPVTAADALAGFLRTLGVPGQDIPPGEDERAARYRTLLAGKQVLIVLDNVSQAEQVRPLLPGTAHCAVLVTSRDALAGLVARDGAARLDLNLLPLDEAVILLRELIGQQAEADPEAAAALARHCCRLPLALRVAAELAASRPAVPLKVLVTQLADQQRRLDELDAGGDPRTAIRAVFSWSYRNLDPNAARTFRLAGLHPGPDFEAYATAALTATTLDQANRMLNALTRAHLIHPTGPGRYAMHDLLRAYARDLAAAEESDDDRQAAMTCLFDYYLRSAGCAMDTLHPAERHRRPPIPAPASPVPPLTDPATARAWLDTERATLTGVAGHTAEHGWPGHATRLASILFRYLDAGGHYSEAIVIHAHALDAARHTKDPAAEARALNALAGVSLRRGDYQEAAARFEQALTLFRQVRDRGGQARVLHNLGNVYRQQGRYQQAAELLREAVKAAQEVGDRLGQARALDNLGVVRRQQGRYRQAISDHRRALTLTRELGATYGQAFALDNLGSVYLRQGHYRQASASLDEALVLFRQIGDRLSEADTLINLGALCLAQRHLPQASRHLERALALSREAGERAGQAEALNRLGEVLLASSQPRDARARHNAALDLARQIGEKYEQARAHVGLGHAHRATGEVEQAGQHLRQALTLFTELGAPEADLLRARLAAES